MNKDIRKTVRFTQEEIGIINQKMLNLGITSSSQYIRNMSLYGFIVKRDNTQLNNLLNQYDSLQQELNAIGSNVNQIAKRLNTSESVYREDIVEIKTNLKNISAKVQKSLNEVIKKYQEENNGVDEYHTNLY